MAARAQENCAKVKLRKSLAYRCSIFRVLRQITDNNEKKLRDTAKVVVMLKAGNLKKPPVNC